MTIGLVGIILTFESYIWRQSLKWQVGIAWRVLGGLIGFGVMCKWRKHGMGRGAELVASWGGIARVVLGQ